MAHNIYVVYRATCKVTDKVYIGKTINGTRKNKHYTDAAAGSNTHFHKALRKYDRDMWEWDIVAISTNEEDLSKIEVKIISQYNSYHNGYNGTLGGDGGSQSPEVRKKISETLKDRHKNGTLKQWNKGKTGTMLGKKHTDAAKLKMKQAAKRRKCLLETT